MSNPRSYLQNTKIAGFTILELLVSVSVFSVVVFISIGAVVSIFGTNRKTDNIRKAIDNANFAFEVITRETRFGSGFLCDGVPDCVGGSSLSFTANDESTVRYEVVNGRLSRSIDGGVFFPLTSSNFIVEDLSFNLKGGASGDGVQSIITVYLKGLVESAGNQATVFDIQTTASPRLLDI